jgi:hypothetical protein
MIDVQHSNAQHKDTQHKELNCDSHYNYHIQHTDLIVELSMNDVQHGNT